MNRQQTHLRRTQHWRMNRNMQKRRVNLFHLEQRVKKLEGQAEIAILDNENTQDLMKCLERKVADLINENKRLKKAKNLQNKTQKATLWRWLSDLMKLKLEP